WGTWLSCEEVALDAASIFGKRHGFVCEVPADPAQTSGAAIVGMGRFAHEAVAVDPASGIVYMTEDDRNVSALYRYVPNNPGGGLGALAQGGTLQAARVVGRPNMSLLTPQLGEIYALEWVTIGDPDKGRRFVSVPNSTGTGSGPFAQAWEQGALRISRGEGITFAAGQMFIVDTSAGVDAQGQPGYGDGAIWALDLANQTLRTVFVSASPSAANNPDNITLRPGGGLFFCEDGGGVQDVDGFGNRIMGLTVQGETFIFARNNVVVDAAQLAAAGKVIAAGDYRSKEFCGACFDPTGQILFVNIQTPGITFAITGPWNVGAAMRSDRTGGFLLR
ncbi:MAG: alkaline phosphatase PhoX, partial [Burkholderiaceae bacterium]